MFEHINALNIVLHYNFLIVNLYGNYEMKCTKGC